MCFLADRRRTAYCTQQLYFRREQLAGVNRINPRECIGALTPNHLHYVCIMYVFMYTLLYMMTIHNMKCNATLRQCGKLAFRPRRRRDATRFASSGRCPFVPVPVPVPVPVRNAAEGMERGGRRRRVHGS